jgi:hypothetical protein
MTGKKQAVYDIVMFYPSTSLVRQMAAWARKHAEGRVMPAFARSVHEIRSSIEATDLVLVDATQDHAQAIDAFSQVLGHLGSGRTVVYTERMHEGLELFVRTQGAQLLFGPLSEGQWEGFFGCATTAMASRPAMPKAA